MKEQRYFERTICGYGWGEDDEKFHWLLRSGWQIKLAIPIQSGQSSHTYTSAIHYVLEREVK